MGRECRAGEGKQKGWGAEGRKGKGHAKISLPYFNLITICCHFRLKICGDTAPVLKKMSLGALCPSTPV